MLADTGLTGAAWCRAYSDLVDGWLADLLAAATIGDRPPAGLALVAVGGYGRQELCPASDLDVVLLHSRGADPARVAAVADRIWYPVWDEGLHLGHSVCTVRQARALASANLHTATALLSARLVAGDADLAAELREAGGQDWRKRSERALAELAASVDERHRRAGDAAFALEPDLKEARGGLRDVHAMAWAAAAGAALPGPDVEALGAHAGVLLAARVELQRRSDRPGNVLLFQEQPAVAAALGLADADALLAAVAGAARRVAWTSDDCWRQVRSTLRGPPGRGGQRARSLAPGVELVDGEVALARETVPDSLVALRMAAAAAGAGTAIAPASLARLAAPAARLPEPWPAEARRLLVDLLAAGRPAIAVIEALDHRGVWERLVPEWPAVRSRPQHNAYHRFTVDRHLLETAANAAGLAARVARPDLLLLGALLHDVGKGAPGDHSVAGVAIARVVLERMGFSPEDVVVVAALVAQHLLLPEVASRRDIDDPATIERVASAVPSVEVLHLLAALTEADARATGPAAWTPWRAGLVAALVERVERQLSGAPWPGAGAGAGGSGLESRTLLPGGRRCLEAAGNVLRVVTEDRPGVFSRVAGVLSLHGLDVVAASATSDDDGWAHSEFQVVDPVRDVPPWARVIDTLEKALDGRLALAARLAERRRTYERPRPFSRVVGPARVRFDVEASARATVIDVHAPDRIGLLYAVTRALAELDLDIRSARVQTMGAEVVDAFYVRDRHGGRIDDPTTRAEIERAILDALPG